ncbi:MAG: NADH-quinone oxidoreductase subunit N, partial [Hydrogenophaga sp.]|nr:NADH-quinone oxidoreductase subunit N [Hydrogenophaga sp.]
MNEPISWVVAYPEIFLLVMSAVISLVDVGVKSRLRDTTYVLSLLTLAVVAYLLGASAASGETLRSFNNMVVSDPMGQWLKCFAALAMFATLVYGRRYAGDRDMLARGGEMFSLALYALLGMFVMISGHNFLVIYLGLELLTLSSYALVALRRDDPQAIEAAMKYFVLGALASGFLLYGMSMVYGATGSLDLAEVLKAIAGGEATLKGSAQVLVLGLVFVVAGLAFKLGVVPFHMWVPDVYHGAPTAITLMIGGAPKLAAFAIVIRLLVEGLLPLAVDWQQMLAVLSVVSLLVGNLA